LGEHINVSKFLGNDVLNRIDINLRYLDQQFDLLKQHEHKSSDSIKDYFEKQYSEIQKLTDSIKKEIQEAMNFKIDQNPLQKLLMLDPIESHLNELNNKVNFNGELKSKKEIFETKQIFDDLVISDNEDTDVEGNKIKDQAREIEITHLSNNIQFDDEKQLMEKQKGNESKTQDSESSKIGYQNQTEPFLVNENKNNKPLSIIKMLRVLFSKVNK
jgi:hypothetical protein